MCGVIGIIGSSHPDKDRAWAAYDCYRGLLTLQHRGQDGAGILSYNEDRKKFHYEKSFGLVTNVFTEKNVKSMLGNAALAHVRYATVGGGGLGDLQPMMVGFPFGLGMVHNGNLVNYHSLGRKLSQNIGLQLLSENDLEIFLHLWCEGITKHARDRRRIVFEDIVSAARFITEEAKGGYAVCGLMPGVGLFGLRDPDGIRPLVLGRREVKGSGKFDYCLSSETHALNFLGFEFVRDIAPGEVILITPSGEVLSKELLPRGKSNPCMFEWIYFSAAESSIVGKDVYSVRLRLGRLLAKRVEKLMERGEIAPDVVCPVPDTSRTAGIALAEVLGINYREGLIKNRYVQRSFILDNQKERERAVALKLSPVRSEIEGKNILLVDDSIVRGTTSKRIIELLKANGAKEVTMAVTCPPIRHGCYYGIDFPSKEELFASDRGDEEMSKWINANKIVFLQEEDIKEAVGLSSMCMACINNKYPTPIEDAEEFVHNRRIDKDLIEGVLQ